MKLYYIETTADSNGEHLVHLSECDKVPNFLSRRLLGYFNSYEEALKKANTAYPKPNGCPECLSACRSTNDKLKK